jgi:hypothetical protein
MKTAKMYFPDEEIVKACNAYLLKVSVNGKSIGHATFSGCVRPDT